MIDNIRANRVRDEVIGLAALVASAFTINDCQHHIISPIRTKSIAYNFQKSSN